MALKDHASETKNGEHGYTTPQERVAKVYYVLNFLNRWTTEGPPIYRHFVCNTLTPVKVKGQIVVKHLSSNKNPIQ